MHASTPLTPTAARLSRQDSGARQPETSAPAVIRAQHLSKSFGAVQAVSDVSFQVDAGDVYGFLGPNGSGKSTTIAMLLGLITPTSGTIDLFGLGPDQRPAGLARVGAIIESPTFYPYLSGTDNLRVLGYLRPGVTHERIVEVLELVSLSDAGGKHYQNYSLGMKQRLGIAAALLHAPELLVLDEPTNGLDPAGMLEVRHLIQRLAAGGTTIFISSHLLGEIEQICNRVAILNQGHIITEGAVADLVNRERAILVRTDQPARAAKLVGDLPGVQQVVTESDGLIVTAPAALTGRINATLVQAGIDVTELRPAGHTLERTFLEITGMSADPVA